MSNFLKKGLFWVLLTMVFLPTATLLNGASNLPWTTNYTEALQRSKVEGKPILLFFTGSDWCSWCHRLESEVFATPGFADKAKHKYIFVELDFPQGTALPADLKAQNKQLKDKHGIRGYPTIVVVDSEGQKLAQVGYEAGGGHAYANKLEQLIAPHMSKFAKSQSAVEQDKVALETKTEQF